MTVAVCLRCGEFKHGAFNPCRSCGYTPDDDESLTKHLLVTDHFHSRESLEAIAASVKAGEPVEFDPQTLQQAWVSKAALDAETKRLGRGCMLGCGVLLALAAVAGVVAVVAARVDKGTPNPALRQTGAAVRCSGFRRSPGGPGSRVGSLASLNDA